MLLKEVIDNSIDEYTMGHGRTNEVAIEDDEVRVRDYGRGIPLGKVVDCVSKINTGGKYDSRAFKKSVGLNGVGTKAVNALSTEFVVESVREGQMKRAGFVLGELTDDAKVESTTKRNGTRIRFKPDPDIFKAYGSGPVRGEVVVELRLPQHGPHALPQRRSFGASTG